MYINDYTCMNTVRTYMYTCASSPTITCTYRTPRLRTITTTQSYSVEEVADPLGNGEHHDDGQTERDVTGALDEDDGEADGHAHSATQLARCTNQRVLPDVVTLDDKQIMF